MLFNHGRQPASTLKSVAIFCFALTHLPIPLMKRHIYPNLSPIFSYFVTIGNVTLIGRSANALYWLPKVGELCNMFPLQFISLLCIFGAVLPSLLFSLVAPASEAIHLLSTMISVLRFF